MFVGRPEILKGVQKGVPYVCKTCREAAKFMSWAEYEAAYFAKTSEIAKRSEAACRWCKGTGQVMLFATSKPCLECTPKVEAPPKWRYDPQTGVVTLR